MTGLSLVHTGELVRRRSLHMIRITLDCKVQYHARVKKYVKNLHDAYDDYDHTYHGDFVLYINISVSVFILLFLSYFYCCFR